MYSKLKRYKNRDEARGHRALERSVVRARARRRGRRVAYYAMARGRAYRTRGRMWRICAREVEDGAWVETLRTQHTCRPYSPSEFRGRVGQIFCHHYLESPVPVIESGYIIEHRQIKEHRTNGNSSTVCIFVYELEIAGRRSVYTKTQLHTSPTSVENK